MLESDIIEVDWENLQPFMENKAHKEQREGKTRVLHVVTAQALSPGRRVPWHTSRTAPSDRETDTCARLDSLDAVLLFPSTLICVTKNCSVLDVSCNVGFWVSVCSLFKRKRRGFSLASGLWSLLLITTAQALGYNRFLVKRKRVHITKVRDEETVALQRSWTDMWWETENRREQYFKKSLTGPELCGLKGINVQKTSV